MSIFLHKDDKKIYTNQVDKFMLMLVLVNEMPRKKFHLMCMLRTNTPVLDKYLSTATEHKLVTIDNNIIYITEKGRELMEVWKN